MTIALPWSCTSDFACVVNVATSNQLSSLDVSWTTVVMDAPKGSISDWLDSLEENVNVRALIVIG